MKGAPIIGGAVAPVIDFATVSIELDAAGEVRFHRIDANANTWTMRTRGRYIMIDVVENGERIEGTKENGAVADTMREIAAVMLARG